MPMTNNGLSKLTEEMGEAGQIVGKMLGYPHLQLPAPPGNNNSLTDLYHPDGSNLRNRPEEELGDVLAAVAFVTQKLQLRDRVIEARWQYKAQLFEQWDGET